MEFYLLNFLEKNCFCVHTKLHPGISYSHSSQKVCLPPQPLTTVSGGSLLKYDLSSGKSDWRYPFDLCASIYRLDDLKLLFTFPSPVDAISFTNPNTLEVCGNSLFFSTFQSKMRYSHVLCVNSPVLCVVTINQVQSSYKVPIYHTNAVSETGIPLDRHSLNSNLLQINQECQGWVDSSLNFDFERYCNQNYFTVHIGDVFLENKSSPALPFHLSTSQVRLYVK